MDNNINILITLSNGEYLIRVAIRLNSHQISPEELAYALEPTIKEKIKQFLPKHCLSFGNIVEVKEIFEVRDLS